RCFLVRNRVLLHPVRADEYPVRADEYEVYNFPNLTNFAGKIKWVATKAGRSAGPCKRKRGFQDFRRACRRCSLRISRPLSRPMHLRKPPRRPALSNPWALSSA
ncbi:MAG: hypothetical protein KGY42_08385, partial [Desulfobacterales bacterium]|nr:hypothetical protein [Desulfobacterales bacterium]